MEQLYRYVGREYRNGEFTDMNPDTLKSFSYSDLEQTNDKPTDKDRKEFYIMPGLLSGSDYNGTYIERSNHKTFLKEFGRRKGVHDVHGMMGTFGVAIRLDVSEKEKIADTLNSLENDCILDDSLQCQMEDDAVSHAWEDYAEKDVQRKLTEELGKTFQDEEYIEDMIIEEGPLRILFDQIAHDVGEYWEFEQGGNPYIRIEKIIPALAELFIIRYMPDIMIKTLEKREWLSYSATKEYEERLLLVMPREHLPLLMNKEWSCDHTREIYEKLLKGEDCEELKKPEPRPDREPPAVETAQLALDLPCMSWVKCVELGGRRACPGTA